MSDQRNHPILGILTEKPGGSFVVGEVAASSGERLPKLTKRDALWRHLTFDGFRVARREPGAPPRAVLFFGASFEEEHGLAAVMVDGEVVGFGYATDLWRQADFRCAHRGTGASSSVKAGT